MDHLRVFHDVARALTQKLELEDILRVIMEKMAGFFGPQQWALLMMDESGEELYYAIAIGETQETLRDLPPVRVGEGFSGRVAAQGSAIIVTGLFNARHLYTMLDEQIALGAGGSRYQFSLLFVDLDRFKQINDTHGHRIGSLLLSEVGGLMKRTLGPDNPCFRYGGDEFVAILTGMNKQDAISATVGLWEKVRENLFLTGEHLNLPLQGSFGLATFPEDGVTMKEIIVAADTMMYAAK